MVDLKDTPSEAIPAANSSTSANNTVGSGAWPNTPIPTKRYFSISEVSELLGVKAHVLRYWEQEFNKLRPSKRGNRRYYQYDEVLLVRRIRDLLYGQHFTIKGARAILNEKGSKATPSAQQTILAQDEKIENGLQDIHVATAINAPSPQSAATLDLSEKVSAMPIPSKNAPHYNFEALRLQIVDIINLLTPHSSSSSSQPTA